MRRKHKTLDMIWPDSEIYCLCCHEPLLIIPNSGYLACRWSGEVYQVRPGPPLQVAGKASFECLYCGTMRLKIARQIIDSRTVVAYWCSCGYVERVEVETVAEHFLPTDCVIEWVEPSLLKQAMIENYKFIKQAVREVLKEQRHEDLQKQSEV
jgi:hypothetical protein